jgi:hypothetical protein
LRFHSESRESIKSLSTSSNSVAKTMNGGGGGGWDEEVELGEGLERIE